MTEQSLAPSADVQAWEAIVADPDHLVDQAIEARSPVEGHVVLEIGSAALAMARRYAGRAKRVFAAIPEKSSQSELLPDLENLSVIRADESGLPLRDASVDVAIARLSLIAADDWISRLGTAEIERVVRPEGHLFFVEPSLIEGELGRLLERAYVPESARAIEQERIRAWLASGYEPILVESSWRAPGRSILRKVLAAEMASLPSVHVVNEVGKAEIECLYRVLWKRRA